MANLLNHWRPLSAASSGIAHDQVILRTAKASFRRGTGGRLQRPDQARGAAGPSIVAQKAH